MDLIEELVWQYGACWLPPIGHCDVCPLPVLGYLQCPAYKGELYAITSVECDLCNHTISVYV